MKAPAHWYRPPGLRAFALTPLAWLVAAMGRRRMAGGARARVEVPVICVGNIHVGGTGKTPVVIAISQMLRAAGHEAHVLLRGHGGRHASDKSHAPLRVDERQHDAALCGDEALLHAAYGPTWIARDRAAGAAAAVTAGARVIVMDDGFQNFDLHKDLSLVVVDAARGWGNGRVMPAGPLREPQAQGLARADALVLLGVQNARQAFARANPTTLPVLGGELKPLQTGMTWAGLKVIAFAGIGHPQKFFATLKDLGAQIVSAHEFGDHEPYTPSALARLLREAQSTGAQLVTTEKDLVRLPRSFRGYVLPVPVQLEFANEAAIAKLLAQVMDKPA